MVEFLFAFHAELDKILATSSTIKNQAFGTFDGHNITARLRPTVYMVACRYESHKIETKAGEILLFTAS